MKKGRKKGREHVPRLLGTVTVKRDAAAASPGGPRTRGKAGLLQEVPVS